MQQPHCAHLMWLDTSGPSTALAALAPLPLGSLSSAAVSPSLEHVLLRTVTGDVALADTTYTIPEQLPRLTKTVSVVAERPLPLGSRPPCWSVLAVSPTFIALDERVTV
eukprot:1161681-Pelagomonas_calceolata.AAC.20